MGKSLPSDLLDLVSSWSLNDIFNENLYKDQVENIPQTFHSDSQYLSSFIFPLLEETRGEFCSSMEVISTAPFAEITHIVQNYDKKKQKLFYDMRVSPWKNKFIARSNEIYIPSTGDILVLTDSKVETVSDLSRYGNRYVLASITKINLNDDIEYHYSDADEDENSQGFTVCLSNILDDDCETEKYRYVIFLFNLTTNCRIWKSLSLGRGLNPHSNMIKNVLSRDLLLGSCDQCPQHELHTLASSFAELNDSQRGAILDSIATAHCNHRTSVKLIWGPPGTGKTKTLSALLWSLSTLKFRVLTCTPTNVALAEVASRVLKLAQSDSLTGSSGFSHRPLGEIVLFGNAKRLKLDDNLIEIYLNYRVDRLLECLSPKYGWRYHLSSMIMFLECCVSKYHQHQGMDSTTFLEFMREKFGAFAFPLRTCMVSLCTHLSLATVTRKSFEDMITLVNLLDSFGSLLSQVDIGDKELEEIFIQLRKASDRSVESLDKSCCGLSESSNVSTLYNTGNHLMHILSSLRMYCKTPEFRLDERLKAQHFCLNQASLIFCTVSTSFRLHLHKHPFQQVPCDLLIIDEASQLKESESTIPLQLEGIKHAILIGDECQLSATVKSKVSESAGFGRSLFERLSALGHPKHLLDIQYRMHPSISLFPNAAFYSDCILDADNVKCKSYEKSYIPGSMYGPFSFINVDGKEEQDVGHSQRNMIEVGVTLRIVQSLYQVWRISQQKLSIGIISPYAAQVAAIEEKLKRYQIHNDFMVNAKSVDGFQGGEEDVIIISTVRSNCCGNIGFLSNRQRANVALTRARHCLWIIGNGATLAESGSVWESLVHDAKQRGCFFNAYEDKDLAKIILQVKKEIDQMDDLLNKDSMLFRNASWRVLFSGDFLKSFRNLKSTQLKKGVLNLLLKLAGGWRPKRCNVDTVAGMSSQLIKQLKIEGLYIICTIDIMKYSYYTQVLKVWDILPLSEIPKLIKRLDSVFLTYTDDYVNRCCETKYSDSVRNSVVPAIWDGNKPLVMYKSLLTGVPSEGSDDETVDARNYVENSKVSESLLLMKFYSLTSGAVNHLLSNCEGKEIDLPFEVTDQEREIILYPRTSFILGRSGTGKTTVLTMKLIQKEQLGYLSLRGHNGSVVENSGNQCQAVEGLMENENFLRQLFVTVSPKLCAAVRDHIHRLKSFVCGGEFSATTTSGMHDIGDNLNAFSDIPDSFSNIPIKHWPLVITFQKFLIMLDGSLEKSFFEKYHDGSELSLKGTGVSKAAALQALVRQKEVTYARFTSLYWPHFNSRLTKNLDSSIVFTEIISHIKGGLKTYQALDGKLSREDYVRLSEGRASAINFNERELVYDIFLDYEKKKLMKREFDLSDLVNDLHHRVKLCGGHVGDRMDFVYVDEVQDLTMRQISLFRYVCKNFSEGFVFAGDTAQTIARGIDFRFQDIRSLFYSAFLSDQTTDSLTKSKAADKSISDMFHLSQNFRTHSGVLKLAQSVIDILYFYFPGSIDHLQPETSLIFGEPPILLESGNDENAIMTLFGNCVDHNNTRLAHGFGADQVVLVRDEYSKQKISVDVGKQALVLTILECKGLEFQDVLLYNFFRDSPLKNHWRVVYDYMNSHNLLDTSTSSFRSFELTRHNVLCSELKQLYVAITRTRQRLWICENVDDCSKPMFDYWKKLCLVQVRHLDVSITQAMFVTSSSEEWSDRGIKLFNDGNYEMATYCFERAGDVFREQWSRASGLRASAERIIHSNSEAGRHLLTEAAEIYENIGKVEFAAVCHIELKNFERAGTIYLEKCGESRLQDAGDCFSQAKCWSLAANAYAKGKCYSKCLSVCSTGKLFDEGLRYIEKWRGCRTSEQSDIVEECMVDWEEIEFPFLERCARYHHELKDSKHMLKFVNAFNSINTARSFLLPRGYLDELLSMEEELGNYIEAANLAKMKGEILLQADMLEKAGQFEASFRLVIFYVVANSLWTVGSHGWPLKVFEQKEDLLKRAKFLAETSSESSFESMNVEISILEDKETGVADLVKILNSASRLEIVMVQIFASHKLLDIHLQSDPSKFSWESELDDHPGKQVSKMQRNLLTTETMVYAWNIWKQKICSVLDSLGKVDEHSEDGSRRLREFCIDYFGFQRNNDRNYIVHYPDAFFLRESGHRSFKKDGKLSLIENDQFVSAARGYWVSELLSVGMKVLVHLEALSRFHMGKTLSSGCRGIAVLRIFQLSKFLINFRLAYKKSDSKSLQDTLAASKRRFFSIVFPIDWGLALTESMITLREKDLAEELLKEVIVDNINGKLTYGKIGRVAMIFIVISKLDEQLYETILSHLGETIPWKMFIEQLRTKEPGCEQRILVASSLRDALRSTFDINWQNEIDYISPPSFLYLLERLLFTVTARQPYFFATKSSFAEFLGSGSWGCFEAGTYDHVFFTESINFFTYVCQQILFNQHGTTQWIVKSKLTVHYYPSLVLKLIIMLGIVCINSGLLFNMLVDVLKFKEIIRALPKDFYCYLRGVGVNNVREKFATALVSIGDLLVMVRLTRDVPNIMQPNCLSVDMSIKQSKDDIMNKIFPKNSSVPHQSKPHRESGTSDDTCVSSDSNVHACEIKLASDLEICKKKTATIEGDVEDHDLQEGHDHICSTLDTTLVREIKHASDLEICKKKAAAIESDVEDYDLQKGYHLICSTLDTLILEHKRGGCDYNVVASELKTNVENFLAILESQTSIVDQSIIDGDDRLIEVKCLLDELIELGTVLNEGGNALAKNIGALDEIVDRLKQGRPRFQPLFSLPREVCNSKGNSADAVAVSAENDHGNKGTSNKSKQQKKSKKKGRKGKK